MAHHHQPPVVIPRPFSSLPGLPLALLCCNYATRTFSILNIILSQNLVVHFLLTVGGLVFVGLGLGVLMGFCSCGWGAADGVGGGLLVGQ